MRAQLQQKIFLRGEVLSGDTAARAVRRPPLELTRTTPVRSAMLSGGIGYVEVRQLESLGSGAAMLAEELNRVSGADSLIVDLRGTQGDRPDLLALLASWLFDTAPAHLPERHHHATELGLTSPDSWALPSRFLGRDVLFVVSGRTSAVALAMASQLQRMGRALVVGEPPVSFGPVENTVRSLAPDLCSPARLALIAGHLLALHRLIICGGPRTGALRATKTLLERRLTQIALSTTTGPLVTRC